MSATSGWGFLPLMLVAAALCSKPASAELYLYVVNELNDSVSVVNVELRSVVYSVRVGRAPSAIAADPEGVRVYVTNRLSDSVYALSTQSPGVAASMFTGSGPRDLVVAPESGELIVLLEEPNSLATMDPETRLETGRVLLSGGAQRVRLARAPGEVLLPLRGADALLSVLPSTGGSSEIGLLADTGPYDAVVDSAGEAAWVTSVESSIVTVVDLEAGAVEAVIPLSGLHPMGIEMSAGDLSAVVAIQGDNEIAILDTNTWTEVGSVPVGAGPTHVTIDRGSDTAFVTNYLDDTVSIVSLTDRRVVSTIRVGDGPRASVLVDLPARVVPRATPTPTPRVRVQDTAYTFGGRSRLLTYDLDLLSLEDERSLRGRIADIVVADSGRLVLLCLIDDDEIAVFDAAARAVVDRIPVGNAPGRLALTQDETLLFVAALGSRTIEFLDLQRRERIASVSVEGQPTGLAVSPDGEYVVVGTFDPGRLSLIDAKSRRVKYSMDLAGRASAVAFDPSGRFVYASTSDQSKAAVLVLDRQRFEVLAVLDVPTDSAKFLHAPDGVSMVYLQQYIGSRIINTASHTIDRSVDVSGSDAAFSTDGTTFYSVSDGLTRYDEHWEPLAEIEPWRDINVIALGPTVARPCVADCDGDRRVSVGELVRGVAIALGAQPVATCLAFDPDQSMSVSSDELVRGVRNAIEGCPT